jgi:hypothetical protein
MRRGLLALLAVLAALVAIVAAGPAYGRNGSNPPLEYVRYKGENVQKTYLYHYDWHYRTASGQWIHNTWTAPGYESPTTQPVAPNTRVNVVIRSPMKPDKLNIRNYHLLVEGSPPKGGEFVPSHLYPIRNKSGEIIKWGAWFTVEWGNEHHNLVITTKWLPDPGTGHPYGTEVRLAHVRP